MNIALRILEIVLPVLAIIAFGYFIGRSWKPDMRVVNRLNLDVFGPFLVLAYLSDKGVDLVSLWRGRSPNSRGKIRAPSCPR